VELRESLHLSEEEIKEYLIDLKRDLFEEGFILSTCNRTEIYGFPKNPNANFKDIQQFLKDRKSQHAIAEEHFQNFFSCGAVNHLFKVAAGIDSLLVGDNQILGQTKEAFQFAEDSDMVGFLLKRIIDSASIVGKRAKSETTISDGAITVSYAAVQLIEKIFLNFSKKSALIIGAGETAEIAAKHLHDKSTGKITIVNRTLSKAQVLAEKVRGGVLPFESFKEHLKDYDIIVSATSAPDLILTHDDIKTAMKKRGYQPIAIADIAIPRDVDHRVRDVENVFYHDIDSLKVIVDQNMKKRSGEIPKVQDIIMEELVTLFGWYNSLEVTPTIKSLRQKFEDIRDEEVKRMLNKFSPEDAEKVEMITRKIVNKLLHQPTVELKKLAENGINGQEFAVKISAVKSLFGLSDNGETNKN
jgi:glutamyl-tRNA reductase